MKTVTIGLASYDEMKKRTLAIARGEYKPKRGEPKIWFSSIESLAQVLSTKNKLLLEIIRENEPTSIKELAEMTGRQRGNLSRTLKTMQNYGLVELKPSGKGKELMPVVPYQNLKVDFEMSLDH